MRLRASIVVLTVLVLPVLVAGQDAEARRNLRRTPVVRVVEKVGPAVVSIRTQALVRRRHPLDSFFQFGEPDQGTSTLQDYSLGSGVLIDPKGYVVTNDHVIRRADRIMVGLADGRVLDAELVGTDSQNDIAVLRIHGDGVFPTAPLGRDDDLMVGETTIALGNPFGLSGSVTTGVLSHTNREVRFRGKPVFKDFIQTSAVINPGNSGGPLLNILGEVIGINVAIHNRGPGIGFAIPISRVREVVYNVLDPRISRRLWLGLDVDHGRENAGALVNDVDPNGPAHAAGIRSGDVIVSLRGKPLSSWIDFETAIVEMEERRPVPLEVRRGNRTLKVELTPEPPPPSPAEKAIFKAVGFVFDDLPAAMARRTGLKGVLVTSVDSDSPAAEVGLQPGDLILELGNVRNLDRATCLRVLAAYLRRGRRIPVYLYREADDGYYGGDLPIRR